MTTKVIIELLKERETDFLKIKSFSKSPGIYAFFFIGESFPLLGDSVSKDQIIYIGKTESSQEKRDAKTHFTTDKTGSSTVRKSIGSILCGIEGLKPIPRNDSDYEKGRFSQFKFDLDSEEKITNWMKSNLALSFFEFPKEKKEIEVLETKIIKELAPVLNILKNPNNPFKKTLKQLRKNCATMAIENSGFKNPNPEKTKTNNKNVKSKIFGSSAAGIIYIDNITEIDVESRKIRIIVGNQHLFPAEKRGNPISYSLDFKVGEIDFIANYTAGSKDGKSRSGILKLGDDIYNDTLKITKGTKLKISKSKENKYSIEMI
jgi:hypothetical protein